MESDARTRLEPGLHRWRVVGAHVVEHHMERADRIGALDPP